MSRGRKTPTELKLIQGTERPDRENAAAPSFDLVDEFPEPRQHLNVDGADMWKDLGPKLVAAKVLQVVDLYALEQLCYSWQVFRQKAKAGMDLNASENNALKALFSEFGMTPASRQKVTSGGDGPKGNRFAGHGKPPRA